MGCYGQHPPWHIDILPCIPDCDTTVTYQDMVEYVQATCSGTTGSGVVRDSIIEFPFGYSMATPQEIFRVMPGERVVLCRVEVTETFNGSNPSIAIGDTVDNNRIMGPNDSRLKKLASFEVGPDFEYTTVNSINLYPNPSSSTTGSGVVILEIDFI
jgi:hypothetical protein